MSRGVTEESSREEGENDNSVLLRGQINRDERPKCFGGLCGLDGGTGVSLLCTVL